MAVEIDSLLWTLYYLHDEDRNCYLVGFKLSGERVTQESHPLNNREALMMITSRSSEFSTEYVPFVWNDKVKLYHTEKMLEVPIAVAGDNFAGLQADLIVRNALVARNNLEQLLE